MPSNIGIKSPSFFIDGKNNIGKESKIKTMLMAAVTVMSFGLIIIAIVLKHLIASNCFYWV